MATIMINGDVHSADIESQYTYETKSISVGGVVNNVSTTYGTEYLVTVYAHENNPFHYVYYLDGLSQEIEFDYSSDNMKATAMIDFEYAPDVVVECETNGTPTPETIAGFNHVYMMTKTNLRELASERFQIGSQDLGEFIIALLELPFKVEGDIVGLEKSIELGYQLMETKAIEILDDELHIELGEIEVPKTFNNSYDYINTECILHLPFTNNIKLDTHYVIGETIYIDYIIDLYSGEATLNIASSFTGSIIQSENFIVGRMIPFISKINGNKYNSLSDSKELRNGIVTPFIEVIRNIPYQMNEPFNTMISETGLLRDFTGFVEVEDIILNCGATNDEMGTINSLLRNGVHIK